MPVFIDIEKAINRSWNEFKKSKEFDQNIEIGPFRSGAYNWRDNILHLGSDTDEKRIVGTLNHELQHQAQSSGLTNEEKIRTVSGSNDRINDGKTLPLIEYDAISTGENPEDTSSDYVELLDAEQRAKLERVLGRKLRKSGEEFEQNISLENGPRSYYDWGNNKISLGSRVNEKNIVNVLNHELQHQAQASGIDVDRTHPAIESNLRMRTGVKGLPLIEYDAILTSDNPEDTNPGYVDRLTPLQRRKIERHLGRKLKKAWNDFCKHTGHDDY